MKLFLCFLVAVVFQTGVGFSQKLLLTVYYESKCLDSKVFILNQLVPTMSLMQNYLQLRLVPFGKAKSVNNGKGGFRCQHGQSECLGNKVQNCGIHLMSGSGRSNTEILDYVACEMQSLAGTTGNLQCVPSEFVSLVNDCVNSPLGEDLQLYAEDLTNVVKPKFVPTITINEHFDQQIQDSILENLLETLCSLLPDIRPCATRYNNQALQTLT